jgi:hypothetical protein
MAQATISLPQSTFVTFQPISASAVHVLARLAAKKAVKEQMRADGRRMMLVPPAEINVKVAEHLALHQELYVEARERAHRLGMFDKPKQKGPPIGPFYLTKLMIESRSK